MRVGQALSREAPLHSGVLQGSVLRPLFFLVFISDLEENINDEAISILKYVDNSKLISGVSNFYDVERTQKSLDNIYIYWPNVII